MSDESKGDYRLPRALCQLRWLAKRLSCFKAAPSDDRRKATRIPRLPKPMLSLGGPSLNPPRNMGDDKPPLNDSYKPPGPGWYICVHDANRVGWMFVLDSDHRIVTRIYGLVAKHLKIDDCCWFLPDPTDPDFSLTIARAVMEIAYPHRDLEE